MELSITEQKARLWINGFDPGEEGWRPLGPVDDDEVVEVAQSLRCRGVEVETFVSPMGKLSYYVQDAGGGLSSARRADEVHRWQR